METNYNLFINGYLDRIVNHFQLEEIDKKNGKNDQEIRRRALDNAFEIFAIAAILDRSFDEVFNEVIINIVQTKKKANKEISKEVKGSDGGIDGIYFEANQEEYTMHVFQCKNSIKPNLSLKQNEIDKFLHDFRDIFIDGKTKHNAEGLMLKIDKYENLISNGAIVKHHLHFIFNGDKDDKSTENFRISQEYESESFSIWDKKEIYQRIENLIRVNSRRKRVEFTFKPSNSNFTFDSDPQGLISFYIRQVKGAVFRLPALQLCELLDKEKQINNTIEKIFSDNIRGFLGKNNLTNEKIAETLAGEDNAYFPFLNNGITIICEKFTIPNTPQRGDYFLPTTNPVIVNGLQTTYLIYEQYLKDKDKLQKVDVLVKLYETDNPELVELITDATNTQSAIDFRDKLSNKKFNILTKELFENKEVAYLTKRGETFTNKLSISLSNSIHSEKVLISWYATFVEEPFFATNNGNAVLKEIYLATLDKNHSLHQLFSGDVNSPIYAQLYLSYYIDKLAKNLQIKSSRDSFERYTNSKHFFHNLLIYKVLDIKNIHPDKIKEKFEILQNCIDKFKSTERLKFLFSLSEYINQELGLNIDAKSYLSPNNTPAHITIKHKAKLEERIKVLTNLHIDISNLKG